MKRPLFPTLALGAIACLFAVPAVAQESSPEHHSKALYVAQLRPMNSKATGHRTTGEARFTVQGDSLTISVQVKDAAPRLTHWQHFHGFKDNRDATCATESADKNRDGIVDLIETEPASGTTMVPFIEDPVSMNVAEGTYPKASGDGTYEYQQTVSLEALTAAFSKAFDGEARSGPARRSDSWHPQHLAEVRCVPRAYPGPGHLADRLRHHRAEQVTPCRLGR